MLKDFYKGKRILITGHTGFKGTWLSKILLNFGANILGYSLECSTTPSMFKLLKLDSQMKSVIGDIRDYNKLKQTIEEFKPEIIIHLAAQAIVSEANKNPKETYEINVLGTINLLECIRCCDSVKSFVNVSTDTVYLQDDLIKKYVETDYIGGSNTYSNSKSCAELIIDNYKNVYFKNKEYPSISNTRSVNVIGGGDFNHSRIMPECVEAWLSRRCIEVKKPNNIRPFLHVLESLHGYLLLAKRQYEDKSFAGNYNFSLEESGYVTIAELVTKFCEKVDNINWNDNYVNEKLNKIIIDSSKARNLLKWNSVLTLDERIQYIVDWNKSFINGENLNVVTDKQINEFFNKAE